MNGSGTGIHLKTNGERTGEELELGERSVHRGSEGEGNSHGERNGGGGIGKGGWDEHRKGDGSSGRSAVVRGAYCEGAFQ